MISVSEDVVKTSVGQPTTLHMTVRENPKPEICWKKDGEPINHVTLPDGSLYIYDTTDDDGGIYTVTATKSEDESSETIELLVLNPQFVQGK